MKYCGVEGIMREHLIETLRKNGVEVCIKPIAIHELSTFCGGFLTNSIIQIRPIVEIGEISWDIEPVAELLPLL